jgi:hypothetical protein
MVTNGILPSSKSISQENFTPTPPGARVKPGWALRGAASPWVSPRRTRRPCVISASMAHRRLRGCRLDGATETGHGRDDGRFPQVRAAGTIDDLVDRSRTEAPFHLPGADLLRRPTLASTRLTNEPTGPRLVCAPGPPNRTQGRRRRSRGSRGGREVP